MAEQSRIQTFQSYFRALLGKTGIRFWLSLAVMVFLGLTEGVGLLFIIPLVALTGIGDESSGSTKLTEWVDKGFDFIGFTPNLPKVLVIYVGIISFYAVMKYFQSVLNVKISQGLVGQWRNDLYTKLTHSKWEFIVKKKLPELVHIFTKEIAKVGQGTNQFVQIIGNVIILFVQVFLALLISPLLTLIALGSTIILGLVSRSFNKKSYELGSRDFGGAKHMHTLAFEQLAALKLSKSYGVEQKTNQNFMEVSDTLTDTSIKMRNLSALNGMIITIGSALLLSAFFFVSIEWFAIPFAQLLLLAFIFSRMIPKISSIVKNYQGIQNMLPAFLAVENLESEIEATEKDEKQKPLAENDLTFNEFIQFDDVSFAYQNGTKVLENLSFTIPKGKTSIIIGPSGKGKSTIADLLMNLLHPTSGGIKIDGQELTNANGVSWRSKIGYIPQDNFLFHDSIRNNLLWFNANASEKDLKRALEKAEVWQLVSSLPDGLDTVIGDRGVRLSGGERQRIILARTLLIQPEILLLDEATSALDLVNETAILDTIKKLSDKMTVILISHKESVKKYAEHEIEL